MKDADYSLKFLGLLFAPRYAFRALTIAAFQSFILYQVGEVDGGDCFIQSSNYPSVPPAPPGASPRAISRRPFMAYMERADF